MLAGIEKAGGAGGGVLHKAAATTGESGGGGGGGRRPPPPGGGGMLMKGLLAGLQAGGSKLHHTETREHKEGEDGAGADHKEGIADYASRRAKTRK